MRRVWLAAAEASGDALGAELAAELTRRHPGIELRGAAGPRMRAAGVSPCGEALRGVVGITEAVRAAPGLWLRARELERDALRWRPHAVVTIDSPTLLLPLGRRLRAQLPVVHWVAPQVWAWRAGRARKVAASCDVLCCLLPFEPGWFEHPELRAVFTGHPAARAAPAAADERPTLALLPGSRAQEVRRLWPVMRQVAARVAEQVPGVQLRVGRAPSISAQLLGGLEAEQVPGVQPALRGAWAALVCSGTASLEVAAAGVPQVVLYQISRISAALGRRLIRVPHVALPNLLAGRQIIPEHLQELEPERIARDLLPLFGRAGQVQRAALEPWMGQLAPLRAVSRVADEVEALARRRAR